VVSKDIEHDKQIAPEKTKDMLKRVLVVAQLLAEAAKSQSANQIVEKTQM
jgi:hypothetical protein